jgi:hypothetical protein
MPAGGFKTFVDGQILPASDINDYLMQGILVFADDASRDSAIAGPDHGMFAFAQDTNTLSYYNGTNWQSYTSLDSAVITSPAATGSYSGYEYYTFTASGTLVVEDQGNGVGGLADVLIIGGGGAGGGAVGGVNTDHNAGGGGAGGYVYASSVYLPAGSVTVTVGAGGSNTSDWPSGRDGNPSTITSIGLYAVGGGRGGSGTGGYGGSGGSAGGNSNGPGPSDNPSIRISSLSGQGNSGGAPQNAFAASSGAGGGGGASANGGDGNSSVGGAGGAGTASTITGSSVTRAGGGGGARSSGSGGAGGAGGGGAGASNTGDGTDGTINTGGGGGGGGANNGVGGQGGSGIVIVRVAV